MAAESVQQIENRIPRRARLTITRRQDHVVRKSRVNEFALELNRFDGSTLRVGIQSYECNSRE